MSRYIDADEFGRCLQNYRPYVDSGRFNAIQTEVNQVLDCIEYEIEDTPSIDIVRCGECRYAHMTYDRQCKYCDQITDDDGNVIEVYYDGSHFCSDGEREGE